LTHPNTSPKSLTLTLSRDSRKSSTFLIMTEVATSPPKNCSTQSLLWISKAKPNKSSISSTTQVQKDSSILEVSWEFSDSTTVHKTKATCRLCLNLLTWPTLELLELKILSRLVRVLEKSLHKLKLSRLSNMLTKTETEWSVMNNSWQYWQPLIPKFEWSMQESIYSIFFLIQSKIH